MKTNDDLSSADDALGGMVVMTWRQRHTTSTIEDAIREEPGIVGETADAISAERGLPRD